MPVSPEKRSYIQSLAQGISDASLAYTNDDDSARATAIARARALITELQGPNENITWLAWAEPTRRAAISVAIALNLFPLLSSPKTASSIASSCNASPALVDRLLRHLAATSVIAETGAGTYASTALSRALCDPKYRAALTLSARMTGPVLSKLPAYLASTAYQEPQGQDPGPFHFAFDTKLTPWAWARTQPKVAEAFVQHMSGYHAERPSWMDKGFFPVEERLIHGSKREKGEVLLVDIGGGLGHDLEEFKHKHATLLGERRLILQELLKTTIQGAKRMRPWMEAMAYNFFTPQPIKGEITGHSAKFVLFPNKSNEVAGARAYYMHSVLHDWPDEQCRQILRILKDAMEPGYSKILINENVLPESGASWQMTSLDWTMMAMAGSAERTEKQWRKLIGSVGLRVSGIWTKDPAYESLIEVNLGETPKL